MQSATRSRYSKSRTTHHRLVNFPQKNSGIHLLVIFGLASKIA